MRLIRRSEFTTSRWKNGGGTTHEAIREPAGAAAFLWRLSVAEIATPGPFSDFSGYRRHMVLLSGAGVDLHFPGGRRMLRRSGDLVEFDGALRTECTLVDGPCADLNLLTANSIEAVDARVLRLSGPVELPQARGETTAVFCVAGTVTVEDGPDGAATLATWDLALPAGRAILRSGSGRAGEDQAFVARFDASRELPPRNPS